VSTSSHFFSHIVAIDSSNASLCPLVTLELPARALDGVQRITLDLCEWQRVAQRIAEAAEALGDCPMMRRMRYSAAS
jgi:hypothetical protein